MHPQCLKLPWKCWSKVHKRRHRYRWTHPLRSDHGFHQWEKSINSMQCLQQGGVPWTTRHYQIQLIKGCVRSWMPALKYLHRSVMFFQLGAHSFDEFMRIQQLCWRLRHQGPRSTRSSSLPYSNSGSCRYYHYCCNPVHLFHSLTEPSKPLFKASILNGKARTQLSKP